MNNQSRADVVKQRAFEYAADIKALKNEEMQIKTSISLFESYHTNNTILWFIRDSANKAMLDSIITGLKNRLKTVQLNLDRDKTYLKSEKDNFKFLAGQELCV